MTENIINAILIGQVVDQKQKAYGDAFTKVSEIMRILYPDGIKPEQYQDTLPMIRILDKFFRIANQKDAFGESPWNDICGYALLGVRNDQRNKTDNRPPTEVS